MFLSILIPTYNRSKILNENLIKIKSIINNNNNFKKKIELIISDNHSSDNTFEMLNRFDFADINYRIFSQEKNIGPTLNCLFLLDKAVGEYIMYLGDDDYLDSEYLNSILPELYLDKSICCVIPATKSLFTSGKIEPGRDYYIKSKIYDKGFDNCKQNSWRGTQLSAVIHYRKELYESYIKQKVNNLYPFVFFVSYNCLRGRTWHMTEYPVTITQMDNSSANVDYGTANLIPDIYDNYKKLCGISYTQRVALEIKLLIEQPSRFLEYLKTQGILGILKFLVTIFKDKSTSQFTKILLPFIIVRELIIRVFRVIFNFFTIL